MTEAILPLFKQPIGFSKQRPHLAVCVVCKGIFQQRRSSQVCCSRDCRYQYNRHVFAEPRCCDWCGQAFLPTRRWNVYCAQPCRDAHHAMWTPEKKAYQESIKEIRNEQNRQRLARLSRAQRLIPGFNHRYKACVVVSDIEQLLERQQHCCVICGDDFGNLWEIDHIVPVAAGGSSYPENLQLLCHGCNRGKWTMSVDAYIAHCIKVAEFVSKARAAGADILEKPKKRGSKASY